MHRAQVWSLVRKLRSHVSQSMAKKEEKKGHPPRQRLPQPLQRCLTDTVLSRAFWKPIHLQSLSLTHPLMAAIKVRQESWRTWTEAFAILLSKIKYDFIRLLDFPDQSIFKLQEKLYIALILDSSILWLFLQNTGQKKKKKPLVQSSFLYYSYKKISFQFKLFKYFFTTHSSRRLNESVLCLNLSYLTAVMNYTKKCIYNHSNKTRTQVNSITLLYLRREIHRKIKCFIPGCHERITLRKWCF